MSDSDASRKDAKEAGRKARRWIAGVVLTAVIRWLLSKLPVD